MTVTLRKRSLKIMMAGKRVESGKASWYLDIHAGSDRWHESTGLFFDPSKSKTENDEAKMQAEAFKKRRYDEIKKEMKNPSDPRLHQSFSDYFLEVADREWRHSRGVARKVGDSTKRQWRGAAAWVKAWEDHTDTTLTIADIDTDWLETFKRFILNSGLKQSSASLLWSKLRACLDEARYEKIIEQNPSDDVPSISMPSKFDTEFLTDDELARLIATPIRRYPDVKRAFLWSCLTGQRPSDVRRLRHNQIRKTGNEYVIVFKQQKTGEKTGTVHIAISNEAVAIVGTQAHNDSPIFTMPTDKYINEAIAEWCEDADIGRHITYKASRHTYCTRLLKHSKNLVVVQNGAGHKDIKSTMRYLHVVNQDLHDAVNTLPALGISNLSGVDA